jgi:predicted flap endonuclease-1-like 5' DNA nuclease
MQKALLLTLCGLALAGCDQLGIENPAQIAAAKEAEGRAVGGACRHSGRALEDCYKLNPKAIKSAVFGGWRDMDAYMRENNIEVVPSSIQRDETAKKKNPPAEAAPADKDAKPAETPAKKAGPAHGALQPPMPAATGRARTA